MEPWVCTLCRKVCHYGGLGDLYGPYKIDLTEPPKPPKKSKLDSGDSINNSNTNNNSNSDSKVGSDKCNNANNNTSTNSPNNIASSSSTAQSNSVTNSTSSGTTATTPTSSVTPTSGPTKKKSRYSLLAVYNINTNNSCGSSSNAGGTSNNKDNIKEVWLHEDCLVWSEGVHIVGKQILKMDQVVRDSFHHNCSLCKTKGATIGCSGKRCRRKFHYICARDNPLCLLDEANFTLKCDRCLANTAANLSLSINR